jgi:AcrR family transcriptional regulator
MSSRPAPALRPRRTQSERRSETRERLLTATIDCLIALGYARTTTTEICARAGVSQGALFKHFPTKAELVGRAAEHLFAGLVADYRRRFATLAAGVDRSAAAIDLLWSIFHEPPLAAVFELYVAARTDAELAASLAPVSRRHGQNLRLHAREFFPGAARSNPDFDAVIDVIVDALQGEAIGAPALRDPEHGQRLRAYLSRIARAALADPASPEETTP